MATTPDIAARAIKMADSFSKSDIECNCVPVILDKVRWYNIAPLIEDGDEGIAECVDYLEQRGILMRNPDDFGLVRWEPEP